MIKDSIGALGASARELFRNWPGLLLLAALYAALLACVYFFFATGVANTWQLVVTMVTFAAAPILLLLLLSASANAALPGATSGGVARRAPRDLPKVLLLALPVAALALLCGYLLYKLQGWLPKIEDAPQQALAGATVEARPVPLRWQEALGSTLWIVLFGLVLPLAAAHLWLSAARSGLAATLRGIHRVVGRAFAPRSVLAYSVGLFVFGLMPYFVIYTRTPVAGGWPELALFGLRLASAFALTLVGWAVTLGALARLTPPVTGATGATGAAGAAEAPADADAAAAPPPGPAAAGPELQAQRQG